MLSLSANRKSKQQMLSKWVQGLQKAQILTLPLEAPASQNYSPGGRTNSHPIFYAQGADCLKCYRRKEGRDSSSSPWSGQSRKAPRRPGLSPWSPEKGKAVTAPKIRTQVTFLGFSAKKIEIYTSG